MTRLDDDLRMAHNALSMAANRLLGGTESVGGPEEAHQLLVSLTLLAAKMPMILDQLRRWFETEWDAHRLAHATDNQLSATVAVGGIVVDLDGAGEAAHALGRHFEHAADYAAALRRPSDG